MEAARKRGVPKSGKVLGEVGPRIQTGVKEFDPGHPPTHFFPKVHQEEAGGNGGLAGREACVEEMKVEATGAPTGLGTQYLE